MVNRHFGKADRFLIVDVGDEIEVKETRDVTPVCNRRDHDDNRLLQTAQILSDCGYILVSRIGPEAANLLASKGIEAFEIPGEILDSIQKLSAYIEIQNLLRGDQK